MSDNGPDKKLPGEEKSVDEPVEGTDSAPGAGLEREDAQPDEALDTVAQVPAGVHVIQTRKGMWSDGSGDTSGDGRIVRSVELPNAGLPSEGWYTGVTGRLLKLVPDALRRAFPVVGDHGVEVHAAGGAVDAHDGPAAAQRVCQVALLGGGRREDEPVHAS